MNRLSGRRERERVERRFKKVASRNSTIKVGLHRELRIT